MPKKYKRKHVEFVVEAQKIVGVGGVIDRPTAIELSEKLQQGKPNWLLNDKTYRVSWGEYRLPILGQSEEPVGGQLTDDNN